MTDYLKTIITSKLDATGFNEFFNNTKKAENSITGLSNRFGDLNGLVGAGVKAIGGFFAVNKLMGEYNQAIQLSNYQLEQETKLQATLKGQGFREEQIQSIKDYASALQEIGVVGDEVTLAGAQQLATYNLTEENLKALLPAMQDIMVQQKGVNATGQDAVAVANMLAKGLQGQLGKLEMSGITLTEQEKKMIKYGNQQERVLALVKAVKENVGEQNKEFLKTPEGKIASAGNRIGDVYEEIGMLFREVRAEYHTTMADTLDYFKPLIKGVAGGLASAFDTFQGVLKGTFDLFKNMPVELKIGLGALAGFFAITTFPVTAGLIAIEDFIGGLMGKDSVIGSIVDKFSEMIGLDFKFEDLVQAFNDLGKPLDNFSGKISYTWGILKGFTEFIQGVFFGTISKIEKALSWIFNAQSKVADFLGFDEYADITTGAKEFLNNRSNINKGKQTEHFENAVKVRNIVAEQKEKEKIEAIQNYSTQEINAMLYPTIEGLRVDNPVTNESISNFIDNPVRNEAISNFIENRNISNFTENTENQSISNFVENNENNISKIKPVNSNTSNVVFNSTPTINITGGETGNIADKIQQIIAMENKRTLNEMKMQLGGVY